MHLLEGSRQSCLVFLPKIHIPDRFVSFWFIQNRVHARPLHNSEMSILHLLRTEVKHTGPDSKKERKKKTQSATQKIKAIDWLDSRVMLTDPPAANLDPSTLKVMHVWGPIPCRGASSLANSFMFVSLPYSSNNL